LKNEFDGKEYYDEQKKIAHEVKKQVDEALKKEKKDKKHG
jgi:Rad3-related DNA helicase